MCTVKPYVERMVVAVNGMTCDGFTVTLLTLMECARQSKYCDEMSTERIMER